MTGAAKEAWPDVAVSEEAFVASVLARVAGAVDPEAAVRELHGSDLYLAFGCAIGCSRAHAAFERQFMNHVGRYVARVDASPPFVDELSQLLRDKLFVGSDESTAKILDYSGRGPLGGWLRVAAVRTARNMKREANARPRTIDEEHAWLLASPHANPELLYLKGHYGREFREAMEASLTALSARGQTILRLHYVEELSSGAIAKLYGVSGAAVRAWVRDIRAAVLLETRKRLAATLRLANDELGDLMALVESRFDLTLSRVLLAGAPPKP